MVKQYKHYSFDLWLTLIKSNPEFKEKRDRIFFDSFNPIGKPFEEVRQIIKEVDVSSNLYSEMFGIHVDSTRMIYDILRRLSYNSNPLSLDIEMIDLDVQELFLDYPPTLYDKNTHEVLEKIRDLGATLNIASNTGFIQGNTLNSTLVDLGIYGLFNFSIFSDEIGISKPDFFFFQKIYDKVREVNLNVKFREFKSIIHIGDNPNADIKGAEEYGFEVFQINSNDKTILDLVL
jgi:putative hydrolase of the HAD superfamily